MPGCRDRPLVPAPRDRGFEPPAASEPRCTRRRFRKGGTIERHSTTRVGRSIPAALLRQPHQRCPNYRCAESPVDTASHLKRVFTFLNITWIHARKSDTNPNFARTGLRIFHFAQNEYIPGRALPFIPSGFHKFTRCSHAKEDSVMSAVVPFFFRYAGPVSAT